MKKLTKEEQKAEAYEAYEAITDPLWEDFKTLQAPAYEAYLAKCKKIDEQGTIKIIDGKRYMLVEE